VEEPDPLPRPPRRTSGPRRRPRRAGGTLRDAERRRLARSRRPSAAPAPTPGWAQLWCDGSSRGNPGPAAYGYVIDGAGGEELASGSAAIGVASASSAEYRALIAGLGHARALGLARVEAHVDSRLVVEQLAGPPPRNPRLARAAAAVHALCEDIGSVRIAWVPSTANARADRLAQEALAGDEAAGQAETGCYMP
jgi:ribonuclease HI